MADGERGAIATYGVTTFTLGNTSSRPNGHSIRRDFKKLGNNNTEDGIRQILYKRTQEHGRIRLNPREEITPIPYLTTEHCSRN